MPNAIASDQHRRTFPGTTIVVLLITAITNGLQFRFPALLLLFRRAPAEISSHEYWRLFTALLVHSGWLGMLFNFVAIAIVGVIVERIFGGLSWLTLYLAGGLVGEVAGLYWKPTGAGASVAAAGLLGALALWLLTRPRPPAKLGGSILLLGACVLTYFHDLHGPPILAGGLIGAAMLSRMKPRELPPQG